MGRGICCWAYFSNLFKISTSIFKDLKPLRINTCRKIIPQVRIGCRVPRAIPFPTACDCAVVGAAWSPTSFQEGVTTVLGACSCARPRASGGSAFPRFLRISLESALAKNHGASRFAISRSETKKFKSTGISTCRKMAGGGTYAGLRLLPIWRFALARVRVGASLPIRLQSAKVSERRSGGKHGAAKY